MRCYHCLETANIILDGQVVGTWCPGGISDWQCLLAIFSFSSVLVVGVLYYFAYIYGREKK